MTLKHSTQSTPWLHIPMEIVDRELYPKLFLACEAIENGWQCVFGTKKSVTAAADQIPPGIVYLKSVIPSEIHNMKSFKKAGHRLVSLDEEGLVQSSLETLVTARYCEETVAETEKFFCWGDIQRKALQDYYKFSASKFTTTGSPTADLWTMKAAEIYEEQVATIRERFGKYILIPSSFGVPNHFMGPEEALLIMERDNMFRDRADYDYYKGYHDYTSKVFDRFLELLTIVAKEFKGHTIILRPHPSEKHATWHEAAKGLENVKVIFEGSVAPWLLGADAILHWGSTTGIEAYLQGQPVIAYCPYPEDEKAYDVLPHLVSIMTQNPDDVIRVMHDVLINPNDWLQHYPQVLAGHKVLKEWIHNMGNEPAIKILMRELNAMNVVPHSLKPIAKIRAQKLNLKEMIWKILDRVENYSALQRILPDRIQLGLRSRAYGRRKTQTLTEERILEALKKLSKIPLSVEKIGKDLFIIKSA